MRIYTEFHILHKNQAHPSEDDFCPFIWESSSFDSDGDYYFEGMGDFWTNLDLTCNEPGKEASFDLFTYRDESDRSYGYTDQLDLKRYIQHFKNKSFGNLPNLSLTEELAVTTLSFSTRHEAVYRKFLETVLFFLNHSKGYLVNYALLDAQKFEKEFLKDDLE